MACWAPVVVDAVLASPIVDRHPVHLDALLGAAYARRHANRSWYRHPSRTTPVEALPDQHLPLARLRVGEDWIWVAGAAEEISPAAPAAIYQTGRRDPEDWDRLARPVNVASGPAKDVLLRRAGRVVASLRWYAWGDLREIRRSLRLIWGREESAHGFVGPATRSGAGEVSSWHARAGDHDVERCLIRPDGEPARHLPASWGRCDAMAHGAVVGPYWHPERKRQILAMGVATELTPEVSQAIRC